MHIRTIQSSDYDFISPVINDWWDGRNMSDKLPKLFFDHFQNTSYIIEEDDEIIGFLIGFLSQSKPDEAYIHFVGVHPDYRKQQIGKRLYTEFFHAAKENGRSIVRCITSPVNKTSIAFHTKMGFSIKEGNKTVDGISVQSNYDGHQQDRVLFLKHLSSTD
jgi:ribosomal protein S18 acetylase RimI-like enzyme